MWFDRFPLPAGAPRRAVLLAAGLVAVLAGPAGPAARAETALRTDLLIEDALLDSARSEIPLFVVFGADWCGWCRRLERETLVRPGVAELLEGYLPVHFDVDTPVGAEAARRFDVLGLPTVLTIAPGGLVLERRVGFQSEPDLILMLEEGRVAAVPTENLLEQAGRPFGDPEEAVTVARALSERGHAGEATRILRQVLETVTGGSGLATRTRLTLGTLAAERGETGRALDLLRDAAERCEDPALLREAWTSYIRLLRDLGKSDEELRAWDEFVERLPDDPTVAIDRTLVLIGTDADPQTILAAANRASELDPDAPEPLLAKGEALLRLGRYAEAHEAVDLAIARDPESPEPRVLRLEIMERLRGASRSGSRPR